MTTRPRQWFLFTEKDGRVTSTAKNMGEFRTLLADAPERQLDRHLRAADFSSWFGGLGEPDLTRRARVVEEDYSRGDIESAEAQALLQGLVRIYFGVGRPARLGWLLRD